MPNQKYSVSNNPQHDDEHAQKQIYNQRIIRRKIPGTMLDVMFSGRYEITKQRDGKIFIDRDGRWFGHVLDYLRDGLINNMDPDALWHVKQEFEYFGIDVSKEHEFGFAVGGYGGSVDPGVYLSQVERYDVETGIWSLVAPMTSERRFFSLCAISGHLLAIGGKGGSSSTLGSVETYSVSADLWSPHSNLLTSRWSHGSW